MTTVATDGKSMAADGLAVAHGTIVDHATVKIWKTKNGEVIGCAGIRENALAFLAWREGGEKPKFSRTPFEALVLSAPGVATYHTEKDVDGVPTQLPTAIGSGMDYALGAMDAGASPERAVEIAAYRNPHTGGRIRVLHLAH